MSNPIGDRNLLFGILALQRSFISADALVAAMKAWALAKKKGLAQILREQKLLDENQHALMEELVDSHMAKHDQDAQKSLAKLALIGPVREAMETIADPDVQASLAPVSKAPIEKPKPEAKPVEVPVVAPAAPEKPKATKAPAPETTARPKPTAAPKRSGIPAWMMLAGGGAVALMVLVLASAAVVFAIIQMGILHPDGDPIAEVKPDDGKIKDPDNPKPPVKDPDDPVKPPVKDPDDPVKPPVKDPDDPVKGPLPPTPGFTALFNGKDLTNWKPAKIAPGNWRVENGILVGSNFGKLSGRLYTELPQPKDFHLRVETRLKERGVGGVNFRCPDGSIVGYEAMFNGTGGGGIRVGGLSALIPGKTWQLPRAAEPLVPLGQWMTLDIIADGAHLIVKVDGRTITDVVDASTVAPGHIVLAHYPNSSVEFRRVEIKELNFVAAPPLPPIVPADGFVALFNGKDLTGWKPHPLMPGNWRVANGVLIGDATGQKGGMIYTERPRAKDFHLRVETKVGDLATGYLRFRCPDGSIVGYEATINSTFAPVPRTGSLHAQIPGRNVNLVHLNQTPVAADQWCLLEILAQGERLIVKVDGKTTADVIDRNHVPAEGHIVLQSANSVISFRRVEIKELNLAAAPPVFVADPGFVPLFNGKDLTGWKHHKTFVGEWRVENGILSGVAGARGYGRLETDKPQPKDFHLRMEARVIGKGMGNLCFRVPEGSRAGYVMGMSGFLGGDVRVGGLVVDTDRGTSMALPPTTPPAIQRGQWFTAEVIQQGNRIILKVDGKTTFDRLDLTFSDAGHIALSQHQQEPVEFRRIEIKALIVPPAPPPPPLPAGFVPLFNGKDLTGWKMHPNQPGDWRVKDGVLIGFGPRVSSLFTERADYKDFHLRFDARINDAGLGGVLSRASFGPLTPLNNPKSPTGFLASINSTGNFITKTGSMMLIGGKAMSGSQPPPPPGEWFTMEIIAEGPLVKIVMNGKTTANIRDTDGLFPMGHIALSLRNPQGVIEFRSIGIKEPNAVGAPPPPIVAADGFLPLFNGKDLTGWKAHKVFPGNWRVENGILTGSGPTTAYLYTTRGDFKDSHLRVEARFKDGQIAGTGGVLTRSPMGLHGYEAMFHFARKTGGGSITGKGGLKLIKGQPLPIEPGEWFNLDIFTEGNRTRIKVNGIATAEFVDDANEFASGHIALHQRTEGIVEFRRIEIKELKPDAPPPPIVAAGDFTQLFNGKDLAGWQTHAMFPGNWRVQNNVLISSGPEAGILHTTRADYKDFHLRMEARFEVPAGASSGVLYRSTGRFGYETLFAGGKLTGGLYLSGNDFGNPVPPTAPANVPSGEWFLLEFIAEGNQLKVKVNGKETTTFVDDKKHFAAGNIALRQGADCKLEFRKIEIKELKPGAAPPPVVARDEFEPLFNAKDLAGWQPHAKRPGNWRVENGILIGSAPNGGSLYSARADYQDFHLRAETRINDKGFGRVFVRAAYDPTKIPFKVIGFETLINQRPVGDKTGTLTATSILTSTMTQAKDMQTRPGEWFLLEVLAKGDEVAVRVNGTLVAAFRDENRQFAKTGHVALHQDANAVIEFRKVEIKDLGAPKVVAPPARKGDFPATFLVNDVGRWRLEGNELIQDVLKPNASIFFGDPKWTDYDFTVEAMKTAGNDQFALWFRRADDNLMYIFGIGGSQNTKHVAAIVERGSMIHQAPLLPVKEPLEMNRWYAAKVSVRGDKAECYLDGVKLFEFKADQIRAGSVGLRTWASAYRFKNIKVTDPDGKMLLQGLPDLAPIAAPPPVDPPLPPPNAAEFVALFDGKALLNWKTILNHQGHWRLQKDMQQNILVGGGEIASRLYTPRDDYRDFHLRLEARVGDQNAGGVLIRAPLGALKGYEAKINSTHPSPDKTGSLFSYLPGKNPTSMLRVMTSAVPAGEWFTMEIIAEGTRVTVKVNGKTTANAVDVGDEFASGHIAIVHDANSTIEIRKVEIKELGAGKVGAPALPPIDPIVPKGARRGFPVSFVAGDNKKWRIDGDELVQDTAKASASLFFGDTRWTDYDYQLEFKRTEGKSEVGLWFRRPPPDVRDGYRFILGIQQSTTHMVARVKAGIPIAEGLPLDVKNNPLQSDRWYTAKVSVRGGKAQCYLDGVKLFDVAVDPVPAGGVGLRTNNAAYRFKNIKVTDPDGKVLLTGLPDLAPPAADVALPPPNADGFIPLFDGRSRVDWKTLATQKDQWRTQNGVLAGSGATPSRLFTARDDFKDFHLRVEARVSDQGAGGVLIRTPIGGARGHEIQINSTHPMPNKTGSLQLVETDRSTTLLGVKAAPVPFGEWFTMDIIAEGNRVTVKVNGKTTADAIDVGDAFPLGCIALRHVANSTIEFRRVEIKLLPSR